MQGGQAQCCTDPLNPHDLLGTSRRFAWYLKRFEFVIYVRDGVGRSWRIIQLMPNRSRAWPKRVAKCSSRIGIKTWPPSERAEKTRSASPSLSTLSVRYALRIGSAFGMSAAQTSVSPIEMRACSTASFHSGLTRLGLGD